MRIRSTLPLAVLLVVAPNSPAQVQPLAPSNDQAAVPYGSQALDQAQQQPTTTVARISLLQGNVSTLRGDSGDWTAATVNTPVVPGDSVSTGDRSRAEVQLDFANIIRLDQNAVIRVTNLDAHHIQIELAQGLVSFDSFPASDADVEIDTPNLAVHPQRDGAYRIEINDRGETLVNVRRGQAEVGTADGSTNLQPGQQITVRGDFSSAQYRITAAAARDSFDDWNESRDRDLRAAVSTQNLSPYYTGGADLDQNGTWQNVPDYGNVWTPGDVPQDWAPYRDGSWVWEPGWGWTWVSAEPWGWAPYHYGRWFLWNGAWAWWPGPVYPYYRPLWAPAYVSFFGFGRGGFGFGEFGWLPIGPADPFFPWWGGLGLAFNFFRFGQFPGFGGRGFIAPLAGPLAGRAVFSNLRGLDANARLRAGITSVSASRFGNGRVIPDGHRFSAEDIRGAQFARGGLPVAPTRASLSASGRSAAPGTVRARNFNSQRFASLSRSAEPQHSFAAESAAVRQQIERQRSSFGGAEGRSPGSSYMRQDSGAQSRSFGNSEAQSYGYRSYDANRGAAPNGSAARASSYGAERSYAQPPSAGLRSQSAFENDGRTGWERFSPQSQSAYSAGRGASQSYMNSQRNQARQPLDLRKSIVQERAPSYGSTRGSYGANPYSAAPRSQPSYRQPEAPRSYSAPHYSAPSVPRGSSGGAYRGGGGNRASSPHGNGGSHGSSSHGGGRPHHR